MDPILAALEVENHCGKPVRVEFTKTGGVLSHMIYLINGEEKTPVLISRINEPNLPCFTELHQQGDMLFLTGADGPCHWSMSVQKGETAFRRPNNILARTFDANITQTSPFLYFDLACRLKQPVVRIEAQYGWRDGFTYIPGTIENLCTITNPSEPALGKLQLSGTSAILGLKLSPKPECLLSQIASNKIDLVPISQTIDSYPATLRWSYAVWRML